MDLKIGELPNSPVGTDDKPTVVATDPTSVADNIEVNDEKSGEGVLRVGGALNANEIGENSNSAATWNLFGRSRIIMHSHAASVCNGDSWIDDVWNPDFPGHTGMKGHLGTPIGLAFISPAPVFKLLYPLLPGDLATVLITQYEKQFDSQRQSMDYHLDITVLDPAKRVLFTVRKIATPSREAVAVDAHLEFWLHVEVDEEKENPISFRYDDPLIFNIVNGTKWNSDDQSQDPRCTTDPKGPWEDKRQIKCFFNV